MKQNLMQLQLKLSNKKVSENILLDSAISNESQTVDYTSKAFYIANQIITTHYLFTKRALITHLQGKPIILQQKHDERPPSTLKAYMAFQDDDLIQSLLNTMIDFNILEEQRVSLKKRSVKRLFTTKKFQFNNFPKVYVTNNKTKKSLQLNFTPQKEQKHNQHQKAKKRSRLSSFLINKNSLPANIQKRQIQLKIKTQKQKEQEQERKKKHEEQIRVKRQQQFKAEKLIKQRELQQKKKQQEKQAHLTKMNNFWLKQKQKIQTFVSPDQLACNETEKNQNQKQKIDNQCLQMAGNVLQMQMKQLKDQQQQRKNPIKPFISWSFMKQTLNIQTQQNYNEIKLQNPPSILVKKEKISQFKSQQNTQKIVEAKYQTKKKPNNKKNVIDEKTPVLGLNMKSQKMEIQQQEEAHSLSFVNSESTDVTMTNHRLQKKSSKGKLQAQQKIYKKQQIFAKSPQDSMFSNSYYVLGNKGQQTVTNKKDEKNKKKTNGTSENKNQSIISWKRKSTTVGNKVTFTIAKKSQEKDTSFEELRKVQDKTEIEPTFPKRNRKSEKEENGEMQHTMTLVIPKRDSQRRKVVKFVFENPPSKFQVQMFSQTITTPEPKTKNKKICTNDLYPIKSPHQQNETKRDSFVNELINDYQNKKSRH